MPKHPHARGEDFTRFIERHDGEETPPRTWGRLGEALRGVWLERNTPTHVGKTNSGGMLLDAIRETPPRTWGRHFLPLKRRTRSGNTPTHVGKTKLFDSI